MVRAPGSRWASNIDQLGDTLVEISTDGLLTGSAFRKASANEVELPAYQTVFSLARLKSSKEVSSFYEAVNILTGGRINEEGKNALPRRGTKKRWSVDEIEDALVQFSKSWECVKSGGSSYYYVKWHDEQEVGKYPSASTISARYGQFSTAINHIIERLSTEERLAGASDKITEILSATATKEEASLKMQKKWGLSAERADSLIDLVTSVSK